MRLFKVFGTSDMPSEIFDWLWMNGSVRKDGFQAYEVGGYIRKYNEAPPDEQSEYGAHDIATAKVVDDWLIAHGAAASEIVLIAHGETY